MTAATYQPRPSPYQPNPYYASGPALDQVSAFERLGYNVLLVFLFLAFSRIFDVKFGNLHITGIAYRLVFAMVILSRGFITACQTKIGKALLGFTIWMGLSVPFSMWRGGSIPIFRDSWLAFSFVSFLACAGLISHYGQFRKAFTTLAWALFTFTIIANVYGVSDNGRLFLEHGKFGNPNEMAQALLIGLPLWAAMMAGAQSLPRKAFSFLTMILILFTTFRTGSRGAMIGFVVMGLFYFLRASIMDKMKLMVGGVLIVGILLGTMPGKLVARYKTTVDEDADDSGEMDASMRESALSSSQSRKMLLRKSLIFTAQHPLFGVGVGMFVVADDAYSRANAGRKGQWLGTHNSYTQVSSEIGIPGFLFFVATIILALKGPYTLYKRIRGDPRLDDMANMALALHYCMILYAVTVLFEHIAYTIILPVLGGLAAALSRTAEAEIARVQSVSAPITMSPGMFQSYLRARPVQGGQAYYGPVA